MRSNQEQIRFIAAAVVGGIVLCLAWWAYSQITGRGSGPIIMSVGQVCVYPAGDSQLRASLVNEAGCLSSSCTARLYTSGDADVDVQQRSIRFTGYSIIRNRNWPPGSRMCTADCGGASIGEVDVGVLEHGTYSIFIGDAEVGTLGWPMIESQACFTRGSWTEILPFTPSPTHTPPPYPWPPPQPTATWAYPPYPR